MGQLPGADGHYGPVRLTAKSVNSEDRRRDALSPPRKALEYLFPRTDNALIGDPFTDPFISAAVAREECLPS